jgi:hypothetical protein
VLLWVGGVEWQQTTADLRQDSRFCEQNPNPLGSRNMGGST